MSQANAAAIKRRANPGTQSLSTQNNSVNAKQIQGTPSPPNVNNPGLTLPQVITLVDKRLIQLETFMNQSKEKLLTDNGVETSVFENILESMTNEINSRFEILAGEISNLKEIVLKLQTYTMDVNKVLFTERFTNIIETKDFSSHIDESLEIASQSKNTSTSIDLRELVKEEFDTPTENNIVFTNS
jgi:hypothetical protein